MPSARIYYLPEPARDVNGRRPAPRPVPRPAHERVPGLRYVPAYISAPMEALLLARIDAEPWQSGMQCRAQHYGWRYDEKKRRINTTYLGLLPVWLQPLADRLAGDGYMDHAPDQVTANEYMPGQGITPHVDSRSTFAPSICTVSLGSPSLMDLTSADDEASIVLERGSLLVLGGAARTAWKHGIGKRKTDTFSGYTFPRARRVSLTFRRVVLDG